VPGPTRVNRSLSSRFSIDVLLSILPRVDGNVDRALLALAANHLQRVVDLLEADDMARHLLQWKGLRGHRLQRELDRAVAMAARAAQDDLLVDHLIEIEAIDRTF